MLLIPVFRGGALFRECLLSIKGREADFSKIVVSINGNESERNIDKRILSDSSIEPSNLVVFETERSLSAPAHSRLLLDRMSDLGLSPDTQVMNLFHDDVLLNNLPDIQLSPNNALVGDWKTSENNSSVAAIIGDHVSVKSWFENSEKRGAFINGSGMIAPLGVRKDAAKMMSLFRTGVRYEFFLMTHRKIMFLQRNHTPLVQITIHGEQDGQRQTALSTLRGDMAYVLWLIIQGRTFSRKGFLAVTKLLVTSIHSAFLRARREHGLREKK